jgi:C-terminal processing protease CtpA/Prc
VNSAFAFGIVARWGLDGGERHEHGSAARAGIITGDPIVAIDGEPTRRLSVDPAVDELRGALKWRVRLTAFAAAARPRNSRSAGNS